MRPLLDTFYNFHWVIPGEVARSSQAYAGFLVRFLKNRGIRAMVNLRGANARYAWWHYERRVCSELGVQHLDVMLNSTRLPTRSMLRRLIDAFDTAQRPFLLKCSGGQGRTSLAAALYLIHRFGWEAFARAQDQFARFPYRNFPDRGQRWLKAFLAYAHEQAKGKPLRAFIEEDYTELGFKSWLEAQGLADAFHGISEAYKRI